VSGGVAAALDGYRPASAEEAADVERIRRLGDAGDPWSRSTPLHVTGSAIILHPGSRRVLLRWHQRMRSWLHVGGHGDAGETSPFAVALREAREEAGLADLSPWPDATRPLLLHAVIVPVPAGAGEPEHQHADLRYPLATGRPGDARPESIGARLRWLPIEEAVAAVDDNLRESFRRVADLLG
jgi:8-oxo-dGTP pyrophosphatase MutT (NUDIX family)